jgi:hypothetical protein
MRRRWVKNGLDWALFGMTLVYLLTGAGITQFRVIEPLTFGLLSKNRALRLHESLLVPFLLLLSLHVLYRPSSRLYSTIAQRFRPRRSSHAAQEGIDAIRRF